MLRKLPYAETVREAEKAKACFQRWCGEKGFDRAATVLAEDGDRMIACYRFPNAHGKHLRTSNVVESPLAALEAPHPCRPAIKKKGKTPPP